MNNKPDVSYLPYPYIGDTVYVIQKKDYESGELTKGIVKEILTRQDHHPRGTKVRLENECIGRIQSFVIHKGEPFSNTVITQSNESKQEVETIVVISDPEALV